MQLSSRTGDRKCVHRTPEGNLHQQLDDSPPTQRKQQDQHQERSTTGKYHIAQAVHGSIRTHIPTADLETKGLKIDGEYLSDLHVAEDILICVNIPRELQQMLHELAQETKNQYKEIQRRITAGWTAFAKHRDIFKGNIGTCLKRHVYKLMRTSSNDIRR